MFVQFFAAEICDIGWCGDYSMRCNIPGDLSIKSLKELTNFTITDDRGTYQGIKINK